MSVIAGPAANHRVSGIKKKYEAEKFHLLAHNIGSVLFIKCTPEVRKKLYSKLKTKVTERK